MKKRSVSMVLLIICMMIFPGCTHLTVQMLNTRELTKISVQGSRMYLLGDLNARSYDQVTMALDANPAVKTLVLTANPGSLDDKTTLRLAHEIRRRKLNTHLTKRSIIASGAVDLYVAGVRRTMEKGAMLGVHSWSDGQNQAQDLPRNHPDHVMYTDYYKNMLGSDVFYWLTIEAAPADSIFWLTDDDIIKFGLVTRPYMESGCEKIPFKEEFLALRKSLMEESDGF